MKKSLLSLLILFGFWSSAQEYNRMIEVGTYSVQDIQKEANKYFSKIGEGRGTGYKQYKRWEYNALRETDSNGFLPSKLAQIKAFKKFKTTQPVNRTTQETADFKEIGPTYWNRTSSWNPGVGRITSIAVDENNYNHIIIGGNTGGVWRTTDKGQNWTPLSDELTVLDVYSVAIDPNDSKTYYWGSKWGMMYKSTNSGQTWSELGAVGFSDINKIIINPTNSNILYASVTNSGFYKSINAGTTWSKISSSTIGYDIEFKPGDPNTIYASGNNVYKSTNAGTTFSTISGFNTQPKLIGVSAAAPNRVYIAECSANRTFNALYKSDNSGSSYSKLNHGGKNFFGYSATANDASGQAPRDMAIAVNPSNADEVHIGGINSWRSTDAGANFSLTSQWTPNGALGLNVGYCHADIDIMQYHGNTLYVGSDGGIFISENASKTITSNYYTDLTTGIGIRQFYKIGVSQTDPVVITGGSQDNGTSVWKGGDDAWFDWLGADGMESFVDWSNSNHLYGTSQNGALYQSFDGGLTRSDLGKANGVDGNWVTPFEQDPTNSNTIYVGSNQIYKKIGNGGWTSISQLFGGKATELKIAPSNNKIMFTAYGNSLYKTTTGSGTWTELTGFTGYINSIAIHPSDPDKVAIATSGDAHVYISTNGGSTWTSYEKNLPNLTAFALAWDKEVENGLYLGMSYGVYYISDNLSNWELYSDNLPNTKVSEIEINFTTKKVYTSTYGRGLWEASQYGQAISLATDIKINSINDINLNGCGTSITPSATVRNSGTDLITSFVAKLYINGNLEETVNKSNITLASTEIIDVQFAQLTTNPGNVDVKVIISSPNGTTDSRLDNNELTQSIVLQAGTLHTFYIDILSQSPDLDWSIVDGNSNEVASLTDANQQNQNNQSEYNFCLDQGCYEIEVTDPFNPGSCGVSPWNPTSIYVEYDQVSYNGKTYQAGWWTQGNTPGTHSVWTIVGDCISSVNTDVFGLKDASGTSYFETTVEDYTSPFTKSFCNGNSISVDFNSNSTSAVNCEEVTFTANVTGNGTAYSWNFGTGATPTTATGVGPHQVFYTTVGNKTISLDVDGTTETKTDYITVTQDQSKVATADISITSGKNPSCGGEDIEFTATVTNEGNNPTHKWFVNNVQVATGNNNHIITNFNNNDEITYQLTSDEECVLNTVTPSNTITLIKEVCTGSKEWLESVAAIYPNPATDQLTIRSQNNASFSWIIYDNHGRTLNIGNISDNSKTLDLSTYNSGIYYVKIITNDKSSIVEIIKN